MIVAVVAPLDHKYVYGVVPPVTVAVAAPSEPPLVVTFVPDIVNTKLLLLTNEIEEDIVHGLPSWNTIATSSLYIPAFAAVLISIGTKLVSSPEATEVPFASVQFHIYWLMPWGKFVIKALTSTESHPWLVCDKFIVKLQGRDAEWIVSHPVISHPFASVITKL